MFSNDDCKCPAPHQRSQIQTILSMQAIAALEPMVGLSFTWSAATTVRTWSSPTSLAADAASNLPKRKPFVRSTRPEVLRPRANLFGGSPLLKLGDGLLEALPAGLGAGGL
jgi:hypothetical protein